MASLRAPNGGTPTHAAYRFGAETLVQSTLQGERFILLITDGTPTYTLECGGNGEDAVDNAPLITEAGQVLAMQGIKTYVIGSPGSESARGIFRESQARVEHQSRVVRTRARTTAISI